MASPIGIPEYQGYINKMVRIFNFVMSRWNDVKDLGDNRQQGNKGARLIEESPVGAGRFRYRVNDHIERNMPCLFEAIPDTVSTIENFVWYPDDSDIVLINPYEGEGFEIQLTTLFARELQQEMELFYFPNLADLLIDLDKRRRRDREIENMRMDVYKTMPAEYLPLSKW